MLVRRVAIMEKISKIQCMSSKLIVKLRSAVDHPSSSYPKLSAKAESLPSAISSSIRFTPEMGHAGLPIIERLFVGKGKFQMWSALQASPSALRQSAPISDGPTSWANSSNRPGDTEY